MELKVLVEGQWAPVELRGSELSFRIMVEWFSECDMIVALRITDRIIPYSLAGEGGAAVCK